jgi:hypothetical protein
MPIECRPTTYFIEDPDILSKTCKYFLLSISSVDLLAFRLTFRNVLECQVTYGLQYLQYSFLDCKLRLLLLVTLFKVFSNNRIL